MFKTIRAMFMTRRAIVRENTQLQYALKLETQHYIKLQSEFRKTRDDLNKRIAELETKGHGDEQRTINHSLRS